MRPKTKPAMTAAELQECIEASGGYTHAASKTGISYRALQGYAKGERGIPAGVAEKGRALRDDWQQYLEGWKQRVAAELDREYPNGIRQ
jgi:hypothetical protein